jgi:RNA polymerase sigma-70 factor (ECF subfamily)
VTSVRPGVADLVRRARDPGASIAEQHAAFTLLVERFEEMALATALRACDDVESARDACQEAFLVTWRMLPQLREPDAFGGWLKRLVRTQCARARRRRGFVQEGASPAGVPAGGYDPDELANRHDAVRWIRRAVAALPHREREAVTRFYLLGEPLRGIAQALGVSAGRAGKCVYTARLRLRRSLPRSVADAYLVRAPGPAFVRRVRAGAFDEFIGQYRFATKPRRTVVIWRERDVLASYAGGQRNVLASRRPDTLAPTEFDGEARFRRDRCGRITHFVYYEFGRRLGVARRVDSGVPAPKRQDPSSSRCRGPA